MSSPLATLKKGSARAIPFRVQPEFQIPPATASIQLPTNEVNPLDVDKALLDDVVNAEIKKKDPSVPTDFNLMQSMLTRIQQLEKQVQSQAKEVIEKDKIINKYQEQLAIMQKANDVSESKSKTTELQAQCFILRKQVEQMEEFLADYGLIWVGDSDDDEDGDEDRDDFSSKPTGKLVMPLTGRSTGYWSQQASLAGETGNFAPNFDVMMKNIKELNILAGEGQSKVHTDYEKNEARLRATDAVPLTIYNNGMVLFDGPFRPYNDRETRQFIVDVLDGYFPSELQKKYPDGVPFKVTDRREAVYKDKVTEIFTGRGHRLKSADPTSDRPESQASSATISSEEHKQLTGNQLSEEQFLGKLPKNVVKNGKIVDIRESVANSMRITSKNTQSVGSNKDNAQSSSGGIQIIETKLVKELKERMLNPDVASSYPTGPRGRPGTPRAGGLLVTLRIRSEDGSNTFVLKVRPSETIGDIRNYINSHRKQQTNKTTSDYAIVQNFPKHVVFEDTKATLEQCGLMSNAALFLRRNFDEASENNNNNNNNNNVKQHSAKILSSTSKASQT